MPSPHGRRTRCSCAVRLSLNPAAHEMQNRTFADGAPIHAGRQKFPDPLLWNVAGNVGYLHGGSIASRRKQPNPDRRVRIGHRPQTSPWPAGGLAFLPSERSRTIIADGPQLRSEARSVGPSPIANVYECACFHGRIPANCFCARMRDRSLPCLARHDRVEHHIGQPGKPSRSDVRNT
jgi:hypothetical protein